MTGRRILPAVLAPVVILTTGACFATRADVRILQDDLRTVRAELMAADTATQRRFDAELAKVAALLAEVADTVKAANASTQRLSGDVRADLRSVLQQLIAIQELTGQSQRRIQELRAEMEARAEQQQQQPVPQPVTPSGRPDAAAPTTGSPAGGPPVAAPAPGPSQLHQLGQDQFRRGSNNAARAAFNELLAKYPAHDLADDALYMVAETYAADGQGAQADSVYNLVVQRYPASERAPTALYKRATSLRVVGQTAQARTLYQQIVDKYPRSEAALLAQDFLRAKP